MAYGSGTFVTAGFPGTYFRTSTDGINWTNRASGFGGSISGLVFANGTFVAVADDGVILTSADGTMWTRVTQRATKDLWGIAYGNSRYVIVGENGTILRSGSTSIPILSGSSQSHGFLVALMGEIGRGYRIQVVTNLALPNWADLFSFTNSAVKMEFLDAEATNIPQRYYRALSP